ncbi:uncharacterized protein LOC124277357 [Haliotis rubra]|uniref:uncharacterized protein LOC124277357 n=1 Tax=Haliotis rubra TaxID=36100 RepID=UPI001EE4EBE0|nr:uncharacterized protein LOC124277357 [Haliotis rubra]
MVTRKLQDHAFLAHLPRYFGARFPQKNTPDMEVTEKVFQGLRQLATWILGPVSTLWDLLKFFNQNVQLSQDCVVHESSVAGMRHLCRDQGWNVPVKFSLHPLNSPACLKQWRVLLHLLNFVSPDQRSEFRLFLVPVPYYSRWTNEEQAPQEFDQELLVMDSPEPMWQAEDRLAMNETTGLPEDWVATTEAMWLTGDQVEEPTQGQGGLDHLFDAHFNLDRAWESTSQSFDRTWKGTSQELIEAVPEVRHRLEHLPVWRVQVCCDPHTYPSKISIDPRYKTAVGLHPKEAPYLNDQVFRDLLRFWRDDHCIVGELGLDHSAPAKEWKTQEAVLRELLPYIPSGRPVVLHVCGPEGDEEAGTTHTRTIRILREILPQDQPIHVHCFTGNEETVREWLDVFPQTYFGFTARARMFTQDQFEGLKAVPGNRVLLETDSPCMPPVGYRTNSPTLLCLVADVVAEARGITTEEVLWATNNNAARFFAL